MAESGAAGIGIIGNIISGLFGMGMQERENEANMRLAQYQNQQNRELAEYQNEWNLQQWQRENEYNSPLQQMSRYQAAGLNPNLIYGSGQASAGNASQLRSADMANAISAHYDTSGAINAVQGAVQNISGLMMAEKQMNIQKELAESQLKSEEKGRELVAAQIANLLNTPQNRNPMKFENYFYAGLDDEHQRNVLDGMRANFELTHILPLQKRAVELSNQYQQEKITEQQFQNSIASLNFQLETEYRRLQIMESKYKNAMLRYDVSHYEEDQDLTRSLLRGELNLQDFEKRIAGSNAKYNEDTYKARVRATRIGSWIPFLNSAPGVASGARTLTKIFK